jgi:hypothetical protein
MTAIKVTSNIGDRLRIKIVGVNATPYVDCDNKNESLESLFKRCVVLYPDGTYVLQVHYI